MFKILETPIFSKQMMKLDKHVRSEIAIYIHDVIAKLENPRKCGKPLTSNFKGLYRYRVGNYRIICQIIDDEITILLLSVGHRKEVYR